MKELLKLMKRWVKLLGTSGINSKKIVLDEMKTFIKKYEYLEDKDGTN